MTNADVFNQRRREGTSNQNSPFVNKSKLNQSGDFIINKDNVSTMLAGNQIIQANPNFGKSNA
jgi:hypothetical protein